MFCTVSSESYRDILYLLKKLNRSLIFCHTQHLITNIYLTTLPFCHLSKFWHLYALSQPKHVFRNLKSFVLATLTSNLMQINNTANQWLTLCKSYLAYHYTLYHNSHLPALSDLFLMALNTSIKANPQGYGFLRHMQMQSQGVRTRQVRITIISYSFEVGK